ncbi:hypothetical protein OH76DRAFT_1421793 [Lentinus brumalis]|uniref:Uncharacterized protein n=1 Tax=Lentinus brumalis TaxID=2498619 RepID=A0A371CU17_9APHY|nr:hypothetical protein OH76DRAFT_1421793 [Polyporus brumalis]
MEKTHRLRFNRYSKLGPYSVSPCLSGLKLLLPTQQLRQPSSSKITPSPSDVLPSLARWPTSGCQLNEQDAIARILAHPRLVQHGGHTGSFDFAVLVQEMNALRSRRDDLVEETSPALIAPLLSCTVTQLLLHPQQQYRVELRRQDRTASDFRLSSERRPMLDEQTPFALLDTRGRGARPRMVAPYTSSVARMWEFRRNPGAARSPSAQRRDFLAAQMTGDRDISRRGWSGLGWLGMGCCCCAAKLEEAFTRFEGAGWRHEVGAAITGTEY